LRATEKFTITGQTEWV